MQKRWQVKCRNSQCFEWIDLNMIDETDGARGYAVPDSGFRKRCGKCHEEHLYGSDDPKLRDAAIP